MPNIPVSGDMEGFGLTALEASASGSLVVASDLEGISDAIRDGKNGFLIQPGNAKAWIDKINELLNDSRHLKILTKSFQSYTLQNYSWSKMTDKYISLFKSLC
jgi:glycosyltransferase involved in cell wall biosynthesis